MALHLVLAEWEALCVIASAAFAPWNARTPLQVYICTEGNPSITTDLSHDDHADGGRERGGVGVLEWVSTCVSVRQKRDAGGWIHSL